MTAIQANIQATIQTDMSQSYNTIHLVAALQNELAILQAKINNYYHDEIVLRGDQIMMREYRGLFGIEPVQPSNS